MGSLSFEPLIPPSLWMALAVAGLALLGWYAFRRPGAISRVRWVVAVGLMGTALGLVLVVLLNPTWVREIPPPAGKPPLAGLVGDSGGLGGPGAGGGGGRGPEA